MRIGIGPVGSGTEHVARQVLAPLAEPDDPRDPGYR